jgi:hypothetical protein
MSTFTRVVTLLFGFVTGCAATPSPRRTPAIASETTPAPAPVGSTDTAGSSSVPSPAEVAPRATEPDEPAATTPSAQRTAPPVAPTSTPAVTYIGMHIGGGPNDPGTKAPFVAAIDAHAHDFESCVALLDQPGERGTFGIDLLVAAKGGHPATSNVRTVLSGDDFKKCMVAAFENVEFSRPKHGRTKLSYSLRIGSR